MDWVMVREGLCDKGTLVILVATWGMSKTFISEPQVSPFCPTPPNEGNALNFLLQTFL